MDSIFVLFDKQQPNASKFKWARGDKGEQSEQYIYTYQIKKGNEKDSIIEITHLTMLDFETKSEVFYKKKTYLEKIAPLTVKWFNENTILTIHKKLDHKQFFLIDKDEIQNDSIIVREVRLRELTPSANDYIEVKLKRISSMIQEVVVNNVPTGKKYIIPTSFKTKKPVFFLYEENKNTKLTIEEYASIQKNSNLQWGKEAYFTTRIKGNTEDYFLQFHYNPNDIRNKAIIKNQSPKDVYNLDTISNLNTDMIREILQKSENVYIIIKNTNQILPVKFSGTLLPKQ